MDKRIQSQNKKEIEIIEVRGIPYYIDKQNRVYKHETILSTEPTIIGEYNRQQGTIAFTSTRVFE